MAPMMAAVTACPVCGQRLASTAAACSECGAILALRVPPVVRRKLAEAVKPRVDHLNGRTRAIVTAALTVLAQRRQAAAAAAGLVVTIAMFAVLVVAVLGPRKTPVPSFATGTGEFRSSRTAPGTQPRSPAQSSLRHPSAPPAIPRPAAGLQNPMALAVAATAIGAMVGTIAVLSRRRRAARLPWIANSAAVAAAFCFGLAVALLVIATVEHQRIFASAVPTAGNEQSLDARHREAPTVKEPPTVIDPRHASLESTPAAAKPPTADILRSSRVATPELGERVWGDMLRDWERFKRTVRELVRVD